MINCYCKQKERGASPAGARTPPASQGGPQPERKDGHMDWSNYVLLIMNYLSAVLRLVLLVLLILVCIKYLRKK